MDLKDIKVILVEDNPDDAFLTLHAFRQLGMEQNVIHLKDGEEAINFIIKGQEYQGKKFTDDVQLVLLDIRMPKVNGIEVLSAIRSNPSTKNLPVVILSVSLDDPDVQKTKELGANSYIGKPVTAEGFTKVVSEIAHYWTNLNEF